MQLKVLGLKGVDSFNQVTIATKNLSLAQTKAALATTNLSTKEMARILISKGLTQAQAEETAATIKQVATNSAATTTTGLFTRAMVNAKVAAKGLAAAIASNPIGAILTVATVAFSFISQQISKMKQAEEEAHQAAINAAQSAMTLSSELSELVIKYNELSEAVKTDDSVTDSFISTQDELIKKLGLTKAEIKGLVDEYGNLNDAIKSASIEKLQELERDIRGGLYEYEKDLLKAGKPDWGIDGKNISAAKEGSGKEQEKAYMALKALEDAGYISSGSYSKYEKEDGTKYSQGFATFIGLSEDEDLSTVEGIINAYERLGKMVDIVDDAVGSESNFVRTALYNAYNQLTDSVTNYQDAVGSLNNNLAEQQILNGLVGKTIPATKEEFENYRKEVVESAVESKEFVGSQEDIEAAIDKVLSSQVQFADFYDNYSDTVANADSAILANKNYADSISKIKEVVEEALKNKKLFDEAIEKTKNGKDLDYSVVSNLIELDPSLASGFIKTADGYKIAIDTLIAANEKYIQSNAANDINAKISDTQNDIKAAEEKISELVAEKAKLDKDILANRVDNHFDPAGERKIHDRMAEIEEQIKGLDNTIAEGKSALAAYNLALKELYSIQAVSVEELSNKYEILDAVTNEVNEKNGVSFETLQKIISTYPSLKAVVDDYLMGIISADELIAHLTDRYNEDEENYYKYLLVKSGYDEDYVNAAFGGSQEIVNYFADNYGIDLQNFKTYIEQKKAIQDTFDSYVADGLSKYFDANGEATSDFLSLDPFNQREIMDIYQRYLDAIEELDGLYHVEGSSFENDFGRIKDRTSEFKKIISDSNSSKSKSDSESKEAKKTFDWIEAAIEKVQKAFSKLSDIATSTYKRLSTRNNALAGQFKNIRKEIELQQTAYTAYMAKANSVGLSSDLIEKVQNGAIDIRDYDSNTAENIEEYKEWYEKALDCNDAISTLHETLASLYEDKFNNIQDDFENQLSLLEHLTNSYDNGIDELEAHGYLASTKYYAALKDVEQQNIAILQKELADLTTAFSDAMASGEIDKYSDSWYDFQESINGVKEAIAEANVQLLEYSNTMREIEWSYFDFIQDRISQITQEADFLIDLMSNKNLYQDSGQLSDEGLATMGLHAQNYNVYMAQADQYADELLAINKELANDPNNTELIERREELLRLQQESILAAEDEKQAIIDMVEEGIKTELENLKELIDTYKDSLDSAKNLYEYQKKIEEKSKNIAALQKQLSAYENDTSEETRTKIQQIKVDLANAQEDLAETEYEQFISDTKELLGNLYTEYETIMNERLDNVDALLADMIDMVNANAATISDTLNGNTSSISETLERVTGDVGYTMSEEMKGIWNTNGALGDIVTMYGGNFLDKLTTINAVLSSIQANTAAMIAVSNQISQHSTQETTSTTPTSDVSSGSGSNPNTPSTPAPSSSSSPSSPSKTISVGGKINAGNALIYDYAGDNSGENQYFASDPIYTVLKELNGYLQVRWHKLSSGVTGWFRKSDVKAYKTGGLADYTGLAQLDGTPGKPEIVLNAKDTENFLELRDALRAIAQKQTSIYSQVPNTYGLDVMPKLREITDMSHIISDLQNNSVSQATEYNTEYNFDINIDHVEDYNDLVTKMQKDKKFEKMICSMTTDRLSGGSSLAKNKYRWTTNK